MSITTERYQGRVTNAAVAVLTAGANDVLTISKALVTNTSETDSCWIIIYDDVEGTGNDPENMVQFKVAVSPKETKTLPLSSLAAVQGGKIWALAEVNNVLNLSIAFTRTVQ